MYLLEFSRTGRTAYQLQKRDRNCRWAASWNERRQPVSITMRLRSIVLFLLFATAALLAPTHALAQGGYFGRNKVQYQEFNFKLLQTEHFDIYFYPEEEEAARM